MKLRFLAEGVDRASGNLLPWVIAVMVYLSALALAGALAIHGSIADWTGDLTHRLTVQIVTGDAAARERQTEAAVEFLRKTPGIAAANVMDEQGLRGLLEPWLGSGNVAPDLPVPALIDVELERAGEINAASLASRLRAVAPDASLDDHEQWLGRLHDLAWMIEGTAIGALLLITLATVAIVIFGTHAGLAAHRDTIETLHVMGAEDALLARAFQRRFLRLGFRGGVIGLAVAGLSLLALRHIVNELGAGIMEPAPIALATLFALALLPVVAALIAMLTARLTVLRSLKRMV